MLFEHEIDTKESFQGSGYVFTTIVLRKIKTRTNLKKALLTYLHMVLAILKDFVSNIKNLHYSLPKKRGGQRPFGIFSENSSDLEA